MHITHLLFLGGGGFRSDVLCLFQEKLMECQQIKEHMKKFKVEKERGVG